MNSPGNLDPANGKQQAADLLERYQYTLNGMVEMGNDHRIREGRDLHHAAQIPEGDERLADRRPEGLPAEHGEERAAGHGFTDEEISGGGLKVVTTFDADAQDAAVAAAQNHTRRGSRQQEGGQETAPGIASIDNATGGVLALYGGADYVKSQWNWATNPRPTGSTFKPYALAAALRNGWTLADKLNGNSFIPEGDRTPVRNAGRQLRRRSPCRTPPPIR